MKSRISRRQFLSRTVLGGTGILILANSGSVSSYAANEKLPIAIIGVSGRGDWFVRTIPSLGEEVVAMCDVNDRRAAPAFKRIPNARQYHDFRKMLDEMNKEIDAVTVATPDNTHAIISSTAMRAGKHVLCEKPLTHDVAEARALRETARKSKVATQMGNQGTASEAFRRSVELIQAGVLGEIREVLVWNTGGGPGHREPPKGEQPVPDYLKWDLWLGPAAYRPFHPDWLQWPIWRDFGAGQLGNWACHTMNVAFKALKIDFLWYAKSPGESGPVIKVKAEVSEITKTSFPRWEFVRYEVPARGELPPVALTWYNGRDGMEQKGIRRKLEELVGRTFDWTTDDGDEWKDWSRILVIGKDGMLLSNAHNTEFSLLPAEKFKGFEGPPRTLPRSRGHEREWLDACRGGPPAMSNFDYAGPLAEFVLLGNIATLFDQAIEFDPVAMKIVNSPEADRALRRDYRDGWSL
jgi:hypothetical protein